MMSEGKRMALLMAAGVLLLLAMEVGYSIALAPYEIRRPASSRGSAAEHSFFLKGPITSALLGRS